MIPDICVIVPTIREFGCMRRYFANARAHGFDLRRLYVLLVTEDFCDAAPMRAMLAEEGVSGEVFGQRERDAWFEARGLSSFKAIVPKRSHAETSFGLLYMQALPQFAFGVFIDDDTLPDDTDDFFGGHMRNLEGGRDAALVSSDKRWVNVLYQAFDRHRLYPRGYPYAAMGERVRVEATRTRSVVCSQGLWTNVPDLDAVRILQDGNLDGQATTRTLRTDFGGEFVAADANFLTVCSMNLAFKREVIPAFYQMPMDDNPWKIGRFDDIWSGVVLKRVADALGSQIVTGGPLCEHNKAPRSTFKDLAAEVPALELNEHFWEVLAAAPISSKTYRDATLELADALEKADAKNWVNGPFLAYTAERLRVWIDCCDRLAAGVR